MAARLEFTLNGRAVIVENCSPNLTLLEWLRTSGLTGSKEGCAEGDCGACSVAIVERDSQGRTCYRSINSCLVPLCLMAGREIVTVEGVGCCRQLHPVQAEMVRCYGSQCGYCTPGFILSLFEGYYRGDIRTHAQLDDQLSGNLCRCTGYRPIRDAAIRAFPQRHQKNGRDLFAERLKKPAARLSGLEFEIGDERFFRPTSLLGLLELLPQFPDARLIAGATELGLDITKRFKKFSTLISVEAVAELKQIRSTDSEWHVGGAVTLTEIEEKMADEFPALGDMLRVFGSRQIRNRATMGGNLVTASPIGDSAPVLLALDASVVLVSLAPGAKTAGKASESPQGFGLRQSSGAFPSAAGKLKSGRGLPHPRTLPRSSNSIPGAVPFNERTLPIDKFFLAYRKTALQPGEVLKTIIVPRFPAETGLRRRCQWYKVSKRREMDISTVAACLTVDLDGQKVVRHARLAFGGVAAMPARARETEEALLGKLWTEQTIKEALPILAGEFTPISDVRGSAEYRRGLITNLLEKFFSETNHRELASATLPIPQSAIRNPHSNHESAHKHVTGEAIYADDQTAGMLEVWTVCSPHARAKILKRDASAARAMPGIKAVLLAEDVPGENTVDHIRKDEILLADREVRFHGQIVALVVGESPEACRAGAEKVVVDYEPLPPVLTLEQALAARSFHNAPNFIRRGKIGEALVAAPMTLTGSFELGGQEHFYLESQSAWARPGEDGSMFVASSTQHPSEVQTVVAHVLHLPANKVVVESLRMGGGFGGKETQAATPAALAALAARHTGQPVRVRWNRDQDMIITGHRHPFLARFKVGFDEAGQLLGARIHLWSDGGWSMDLSQAVTDRALFHLDNAYYIPSVEFRGQVARTNLSSNTAFRGFGGPQGMLVIEEIIDRVARRLGLAPEVVRERNLYRDKGETNTTHYGQEIEDNRIQTIWHDLKRSSHFDQRRKEIAEWNANHAHSKRGLAMTPVKFGISFTVSHLNQAGAFVLVYRDGTVQINHAGTEMGQGLHTNVTAIAAQALGIQSEHIRIMPTSTDKIPNTSATAASCGTDLNGAAVKNACEILRARLLPVAAELLKEKFGGKPQERSIVFADGLIFERQRRGDSGPARGTPDLSGSAPCGPPSCRINPAFRERGGSRLRAPSVTFAEVVQRAYMKRISLSASGYYATPNIHWDRAAGRGHPFHYFAYGAAVSEVEVDGFTGMMRFLRADLLHDVGDSINEGINRGQIEGGFVQGMGWLTTEELKWDDKGRLLTHSPDTYKIPSVGDMPQVFNVTLLKNAAQKSVVHGSKAVGEPPLMLALSVREAIRDAIAAFGPPGGEASLASPATCEAIFLAVQKRRTATDARPSRAQQLPSEVRGVGVTER